MGTTVVVTAKCRAGHIFKFASSREVNGLYVNNVCLVIILGKSAGLPSF